MLVSKELKSMGGQMLEQTTRGRTVQKLGNHRAEQRVSTSRLNLQTYLEAKPRGNRISTHTRGRISGPRGRLLATQDVMVKESDVGTGRGGGEG